MSSYSIIIPIYNVDAKYLRQCVESTLRQNYDDLEILLIDDGSQSFVSEICREYEAGDQRVHYYRQDNLGVSAARNNGIEKATKEYIFFLDADDWIPDNFINKIDEEMSDCFSDIVLFDYASEYKNREIRRGISIANEYTWPTEDLVFSVLRYSDRFAPYDVGTIWAKLIKRSFINEKNIRFTVGIKKGQDTLFALFMYQECSSIRYLPIKGYCYRKNESSVTHKFNNDIVKIKESLYSEYSKFLHMYGYDGMQEKIMSKLRGKVLLGDYMSLYFCHKDNSKSNVELKRELMELLNSEEYKNVWCYGEYNLIQRVECFFLRHNNIGIMKKIYSIKDVTKGLLMSNYE